jgi:hypothetical protein
MSKERDIEILEHKISELKRMIQFYTQQNISQKKIDTLLALKLKYENQLEEK